MLKVTPIIVKLEFEGGHLGLRNTILINVSKYALTSKYTHLHETSRVGENLISLYLLAYAKGLMKPAKFIYKVCSPKLRMQKACSLKRSLSCSSL